MPAWRLKLTEGRVHTVEVAADSLAEAELKARVWLEIPLLSEILGEHVDVRPISLHRCDVAIQEARNDV